MARSLTSERKQLGLGPYGSPSAQSAVGYSSQFGDFGMAQRMTTQVQSIDQGNVPWTSSVDELGASSSNISHSERGHSETPQQQSRSGTPNDFLNPQGQPKLYRFSSRSQNPQPAVARSGGSSHFIPEDVKDTEQSSIPKQLYATPQDDIFPTGEPSQLEGGSSQPQDSMSRFRFQEPVMPQSHVVSPTNRQREFSIVHVKWDSDRKRRQGYFSQEDGAEKSPFRHYNKGKCDFEG
ncbi:hypothetical protein B0H34DRAFT_469150 [Crassisporium funariophilum]|nr:hypothetical protein B0H34DRAFT_469150 [Crassisporium funariophilum]